MVSIIPAPSAARARHMTVPACLMNGHPAMTAVAPPSRVQRSGPKRHPPPRAASTASTPAVPASWSAASHRAASGGCWAAWDMSRTLYSTVQISQAAGSGSLVRRQASRR